MSKSNSQKLHFLEWPLEDSTKNPNTISHRYVKIPIFTGEINIYSSLVHKINMFCTIVSDLIFKNIKLKHFSALNY